MYPAGGAPYIPRRRASDVQADPAMLVEAATAESLRGEPDWGLNMRICDLAQQAPRDIFLLLDALKKKLRSKSHGPGLLAVLLLETLVKNVPASHEQVATRDLMESTLVKALPRSIRKPREGPSFNSLVNEPSDQKSPLAIARWEAILRCVQSWAHAFDQRKYPIFNEVHRMLERRGVQFPQVEKGEDAPVFVKPVERRPSDARAAGAGAAPSASASSHVLPSAPPASVPGGPPGSHAPGGGASGSVPADVKTSQETARLFTDLLNNAEVGGEALRSDELVSQLYATCRSNAGIISSRLTNAANAVGSVSEAEMAALIATHEAIQRAITLYEGLVHGTIKAGAGRAAAVAAAAAAPPRHADGEEKEEKEDFAPARSRRSSRDSDRARTSVHAPSVSAAAATPPARARRKSDLPPELQAFDMLGISPEAVVDGAAAQPYHPVPQPHPAPFEPQASAQHAPDPFDMGGDAYPQPTNPVAAHLTVQPHSPPVHAATPGSAQRRGVASPLLAPPPATSTRSRRRASIEASPVGIGAGSGSASPAMAPQPPAPGVNLFDMLSSVPMQQPQQQSQQQPPPPAYDAFYGQQPSGLPLAPPASFAYGAAPLPPAPPAAPASYAPPTGNVFDAFPVAPAPTAPSGSSPFDAAPAHARPAAQNPFAAFDADAPPIYDDPFAQLASRSTPHAQQQNNAYRF